MFWQEDNSEKTVQVPDDIVDVLFAMQCKSLPVDHAYALSAALQSALPWFGDEPELAVHTVHVAGSQNGWERPPQGTDQHLIVSRRTRLTIRAPKHRVNALLEELHGKTLDVAGSPLTVGEGKIRPLSKERTLFARYVVTQLDESEDDFLGWAAAELRALDVFVRKALCGKATAIDTPDGPLNTRSLMLADLAPDESVRLQQHGLGPHRAMGCGIFIPHKGIDAVQKS